MSGPPASCPAPSERRAWLARRRAAALAQAAAVLLLPFARIGGESALRFDLPTLTLHAFGAALGIDALPALVAAIVFLLVLVAGTTVILGRAWCGWSCPQTALPALADWAASVVPEKARRPARLLLLVLLSTAVSFALVGYVVPPAEAARELFRSPAVTGFFASLVATHLVMVVLLGPAFCKSVCPYAMLQNVLFDRDTLVIAFDEARDPDCLRDQSCVAVCPVGIDIRKGLQRECIACAECIDACVRVTAARGIVPFVGYRGVPFRRKAAAWGAAAAAAGIAVAASVALRPPVEFAVQWEESVRASGVGRYGYSVRNNTGDPLALSLDAEGGARLIGDRRIAVPPRARVTGKALVRPAGRDGDGVAFVVTGPGISVRKRAAAP